MLNTSRQGIQINPDKIHTFKPYNNINKGKRRKKKIKKNYKIYRTHKIIK